MGALAASFRDPSGYVVNVDGIFLRIVQPRYRAEYEHLLQSGLYESLKQRKLLIPHEEVAESRFPNAFKVLKPVQLSTISYPYEWCFRQLKDAALATLEIQKLAMDFGMSLKDASSFNIQFVHGKPTLIDTLSFEKLEARPWVAYAQFCRHFLAPLALMSRRDIRLVRLMRLHIDGIPLDLASKLLPWTTWLSFWLCVHVHLHAKNERRVAGKPVVAPRGKYRLSSLQGLIQSLESAVRGLQWEPGKQSWANYYESTVTGGGYVAHKKQLVSEFLDAATPASVWDLGSNTGLFSRLASDKGIPTCSFDGDPDCVEINYRETCRRGESNLLPLWMDLTNPSPALGWQHQERMSWLERARPDLTLALAIVHHLAIGNNLPLPKIAEFFGNFSRWLVIEFVPKDDSNAQKLLQVREDIFSDYTQENFEACFAKWYLTERKQQVADSNRILYLMRRRADD